VIFSTKNWSLRTVAALQLFAPTVINTCRNKNIDNNNMYRVAHKTSYFVFGYNSCIFRWILPRNVMLVWNMVSSCVCLSVCHKTQDHANAAVRQPRALVFWCQTSQSTGSLSTGAPNRGGELRSNRQFSLYLRNDASWKYRDIVTLKAVRTRMHCTEWRYFPWSRVTPNHHIFHIFCRLSYLCSGWRKRLQIR